MVVASNYHVSALSYNLWYSECVISKYNMEMDESLSSSIRFQIQISAKLFVLIFMASCKITLEKIIW